MGGRDLPEWRTSKIFFVVGHIPIDIFLQVNYFFDAARTSNTKFFKGQINFC